MSTELIIFLILCTISCIIFFTLACSFYSCMNYTKKINQKINNKYEELLHTLKVNQEYIRYLELICKEDNTLLKESKDILNNNTKALLSIPNYIPNKADFNGQEIKLRHVNK